jgi:hypothetical protein
MKRISVLAYILLFAACSKKDHPPRYTGAPTIERIEKSRELVKLRDDWEDATAAIEAQAGAPTSKTDAKATWALTDGASCAELTIERKGDHVTSVGGGKRFNKADFAGTPNTFTECEAAATAK